MEKQIVVHPYIGNLAINRNELLVTNAKLLCIFNEFENHYLSERNQKQRNMYPIIPFKWSSRTDRTTVVRSK